MLLSQALIFRNFPAGEHTLRLEAVTFGEFDTSTDLNDYFYATVLELPFQQPPSARRGHAHGALDRVRRAS